MPSPNRVLQADSHVEILRAPFQLSINDGATLGRFLHQPTLADEI